MRGLVEGPRGKLSKDLCNLIVRAATAPAEKNWAELGEESSTMARVKYLRVFRKKIALPSVRERVTWMPRRFEQASMHPNPNKVGR